MASAQRKHSLKATEAYELIQNEINTQDEDSDAFGFHFSDDEDVEPPRPRPHIENDSSQVMTVVTMTNPLQKNAKDFLVRLLQI